MISELPGWLENHALEIADLPVGGESSQSDRGCYDALAPELRAWLKTQIAFIFNLWKERDWPVQTRRFWLELEVCESVRPAPWALFLVDENYASGPGMLAALLPAVLAKTEEIIICRLGGSAEPENSASHRRSSDSSALSGPLPLTLAVAFELAGVERIYSLTYGESLSLLGELSEVYGRCSGSVVVLGSASDGGGAFTDWRPKVAEAVVRLELRASFLPARVEIAVEPGCAVDLDLLRWAHPSAMLLDSGEHETTLRRHALFSKNDCACERLTEGLVPPLVLHPGQEALWLWPGLGPDFFSLRSADVFTVRSQSTQRGCSCPKIRLI